MAPVAANQQSTGGMAPWLGHFAAEEYEDQDYYGEAYNASLFGMAVAGLCLENSKHHAAPPTHWSPERSTE